MERERITIVGIGLIRGSLALQLHEKKNSSRMLSALAEQRASMHKKQWNWDWLMKRCH